MEESNDSFFSQLKNQVFDYTKLRLQLTKLEAIDKVALLTGFFLSLIIIGFFSILVMLFIFVVAGFYFSELWGSRVYGFGAVTLMFIGLLLIYLTLLRTATERWIMNKIVILLTKKDKNEHPTE